MFGVGGGAALAAEGSGFAVPKGFIGVDFVVAEAALLKRWEDAQLLGQFGERCAQGGFGAIFAVEFGKGVEQELVNFRMSVVFHQAFFGDFQKELAGHEFVPIVFEAGKAGFAADILQVHVGLALVQGALHPVHHFQVAAAFGGVCVQAFYNGVVPKTILG